MEPIDLNPSDPADRSLDALLREQTQIGGTLPDDGFSARVLAALPPKTENFSRLRDWLGFGLIAALSLALGTNGIPEEVRTDAALPGSVLAPVVTALTDPALLLVLAVSAGVWVVTFDDEASVFEPPNPSP